MFFFYDAEVDEMGADELRNKLADLKNQQKNCEAKLDFAEEGENPEQINREELEQEIEKLASDIEYIEGRLQQLKTFNKTTFIRNLRDLLKKSDVKISQIESEANCSAGYLSRLDKPDSTTDPSIEFIATAARLLDVSVDFLLTGKVEDLSQTEIFLVEFFDSVIEDTSKDELVWQVDEQPEHEYFSETGYPMDEGHPLYSSRGTSGNQFEVYYDSKFEKDVHVVAGSYSYVCTLPATEDRLYLMSCAKANEDPGKDKSDVFVECYLLTDSGVSPLCSTHTSCETVSKKVIDLCREIGKSAKRIHISNDAVSAINKYMRSRIPEDLPFK